MYLIDNNECGKGGHNLLYMNTLSSIEGTVKYNKVEKFCDYKNNPIRAIKQRKNYFKYFNDKKYIHILHFDSTYLVTSIFKNLKRKNVKIVATLHWYPTNRIKQKILKRTSKYIDVIIVHSEYIKEKLKSMDIKNVEVIDYPAFVSSDIMSKLIDKRAEHNKKIIVSCIGGTRYDKGLDILIDAFKYLNDKAKEDIIFNIAGYEQDIKYSYLKQEAEKYGVNILTSNKVLTDLEYWENINKSDVILLPYRRVFAGNSGPMTDGIYMNKFILGPDKGNLGFLIKHYNLGETFEQENCIDLANQISNIRKTNLNKNSKYRENLEVENFIHKYKIIYESIGDRK